MSIYKGFKQVPAYLVDERASADEPSAVEPPPVHLRRAQPVEKLLPRTIAWLDSLPDEVRPDALARQFGRIANVIAGAWNTPAECRNVLDALLADGRTNRKGFPPEVLRDIHRLRTLHAVMHPTLDADPYGHGRR